MAKGDKKTKANPQTNPETQERNRLKKLAISNNILTSDAPAKVISTASTSVTAPLNISKLVAKHHGRDILKKSQRKNKFLLSFPGLLAPVSGGKIGELKDLGTKNPVLYLDFPQGKMKLFGTIIFPKNRYLTLQFSRGGKNVMCEDNFDTMIVFSEAWWIGNKDENPDEVRLEFPKEMNTEQNKDYDFKGGAGAACGRKPTLKQTGSDNIAQGISTTKLHDDLSDSSNDLVHLEDQIMSTPSRHSARTARKSYKFAEASSGDESVEDITGTSEVKKEIADPECSKAKYPSGKTDEVDPISLDMDNADAALHTSVSQIKQSVTKSKDISKSNKASLVQATISTLFKKVEEKKVPVKKKDLSSKESGKSLQQKDLKRKSDQVNVQGPSKKKKATEEKKIGTKSKARKKKLEDEDDIEEFSSSSKDTIGSDGDWTA
ncbi:DNA-binding protein RHL1 [Heracleum sosnowskyi]|uniref:DNA-binding protein RHL1 n=1 Tax=Heracleum sosnowskyi TaxID=360622 RepID=A0AAD8NCP3_9APIA|nr:DNA-binding protein RHL1 [Heracleum sosnowskyi]